MLARHMHTENEELDFPLYPDTNMFSHSFPYNPAQGFNMDASYTFPRTTQESYPASTGMHPGTMYAEAPQYALESPDLRGAPSNYSTASGASAASSAMGSPHSMHGHVVPVPEWAPQGLGLNPSIVSYDSFGQGSEYTFQTSGMDDFALEFPGKTSFVGECETITRSASRQHGSISSNSASISSACTFIPSPSNTDTPIDRFKSIARSMASAITPVSASQESYSEECFASPSISAFSRSPSSSRRPSQAISEPLYTTSPTMRRSQDARSSPVSSITQSLASTSSPSHAVYQESHFFSQSSGNFVLPLESSCWFPLSILSIKTSNWRRIRS